MGAGADSASRRSLWQAILAGFWGAGRCTRPSLPPRISASHPSLRRLCFPAPPAPPKPRLNRSATRSAQSARRWWCRRSSCGARRVPRSLQEPLFSGQLHASLREKGSALREGAAAARGCWLLCAATGALSAAPPSTSPPATQTVLKPAQKVYRLPDVWVRPNFGGKGRKVPGALEAHANGFRYQNAKARPRGALFGGFLSQGFGGSGRGVGPGACRRRRVSLRCRGLPAPALPPPLVSPSLPPPPFTTALHPYIHIHPTYVPYRARRWT